MTTVEITVTGDITSDVVTRLSDLMCGLLEQELDVNCTINGGNLIPGCDEE